MFDFRKTQVQRKRTFHFRSVRGNNCGRGRRAGKLRFAKFASGHFGEYLGDRSSREKIATECGDLGFIIARRARVSVLARRDSINAKVFRDSSLLRRLPAINRYRRHRSRSGRNESRGKGRRGTGRVKRKTWRKGERRKRERSREMREEIESTRRHRVAFASIVLFN